MRRTLLLAATGLALLAGTARAGGSWVIVPTTGAAQVGVDASLLPSSSTPSLAGALAPDWTTPPAVPMQLTYEQLLGIWQRAGAAYGIPWQVLAAINKVETNFGRNMGPSSAGAIGWMQFMPATWLRWGTDANFDGLADPWNAEDAIYSSARYLAAAGGMSDLYRAVFAYNHADWYVREVLQLAELFGAAGAEETFTLDRLQTSLLESQSAVAGASEELVAAQADVERYERKRDRLYERAGRMRLLSKRIDLQRLAGLAGADAASAQARADAAQQVLAKAQKSLARARSQSRAASFAQGATSLLAAPAYQGSYVFPVGGGPGAVSVSHAHHDYPAADIAAPAGSPIYLHEDGVIEEVYTSPSGRCGLGIRFQGADGVSWTYCHMAYVDPSVQAGASLPAGAPVGLVGSTGRSSGPHLHLQTSPATTWPQQQAWFLRFAGASYRWQDAPTPEQGPVFAVVAEETPVASPDVVGFALNPQG